MTFIKKTVDYYLRLYWRFDTNQLNEKGIVGKISTTQLFKEVHCISTKLIIYLNHTLVMKMIFFG